ncbi:ABC transporter ATP-binding protein [Sporosarcina thermotolerans]|uniref:ABC transporter ATP-binding protein n=1 Tax=Sporosarcina thermotolerans TaxID=633404 RepID=A0AAW9A6R9_9BACL|nr:ABC transporter ATP-binding protein [Sporosarcina thermotolerans]MDW0117042.1 ABC transporter ATP-binding protein [Sporosarcina thermotolerans]WHT47858.1 ABC transporter ATP-binding protein [Sporosarcina thermotolerans]
MLKLSNVSITYNDKAVLDKLELTANIGEIIGVAAPNGTGKSTMFNVMANFVKPDSGHVVFDGKYAYRNEKEELLIHKQLCTFPEQKDLFGELSGVDHLKLFANMWKGSTKHVPAVIERLQMGNYVKRKVRTYSLGMRQRLCFAMMMAADTPVILLDEVMNGLDVDNVALLSECLMEMKKDKLIFVASHLLSNLDLYADRVLFLKNGKFVHEHRFTGENDVYLKIEVNPEQFEMLKEKETLPEGHIYLANHLLCIPLNGMSAVDQTKWIERMLDYNEKEMTVGPLGTVEYYDKFYSKNA